MRPWIKSFWAVLLVSSIFIIVSVHGLRAADYPSRAIQLIVPFPPGGGSDIAARFIHDKLSTLLGQPVVVINKPGASGIIGANAVLTAPPDGYTIFVMTPAVYFAPLITKGVPYNPRKDFSVLSLSIGTPVFIVVKKEAPWSTLEDFIIQAQKNPGKFTYSIAGYGASGHFAGELFKMQTGTDITCVPMDGLGPSITAVLGGHIHLTFAELGPIHNYLQAGTLRSLAVMSPKPHKDFAEIPTTIEKGFRNLTKSVWQGFAVRTETPREIVEKLEKAFIGALNDKEVVGRFEKIGYTVENLGSKEASEYLARDYQLCEEVSRAANIVPR